MKHPQIPANTQRLLIRTFAGFPEIERVVLYGSRATGRANDRSDIDLATEGITDERRLGRLALELEDLPIPQKCDVQALEGIRYPPLKRHVATCGITIYRRKEREVPRRAGAT